MRRFADVKAFVGVTLRDRARRKREAPGLVGHRSEMNEQSIVGGAKFLRREDLLDQGVGRRTHVTTVEPNVGEAVQALEHEHGRCALGHGAVKAPEIPDVRRFVLPQRGNVHAEKRLGNQPIGLQIEFEVSRHLAGPRF